MKSYTRHYPRAAVLAALVLVASCGEPADPPNLMVASKWTDAIRRFNLVPIYPMQEDVQIGDVFLYLPPRPGERADSQPSSWLNRLGGPNREIVLTALRNEYCQRYRLAPAGRHPWPNRLQRCQAHPAGAGHGRNHRKPARCPHYAAHDNTGRGENVHLPGAAKPMASSGRLLAIMSTNATKCPPLAGSPNSTADYPPDIEKVGAEVDLRMHRVELPDIAVARVTEGDFSATAPLSGVLSNVSFGTSSTSRWISPLKGIEEVRLPFSAVNRLFTAERWSFVGKTFPPAAFLAYVRQTRPDLLPKLCYPDYKALDDSGMQLLAANQVVYAHAISYGYRSGSSLAGRVSASLAATGGASTNKGNPAGDAGKINVADAQTAVASEMANMRH